MAITGVNTFLRVPLHTSCAPPDASSLARAAATRRPLPKTPSGRGTGAGCRARRGCAVSSAGPASRPTGPSSCPPPRAAAAPRRAAAGPLRGARRWRAMATMATARSRGASSLGLAAGAPSRAGGASARRAYSFSFASVGVVVLVWRSCAVVRLAVLQTCLCTTVDASSHLCRTLPLVTGGVTRVQGCSSDWCRDCPQR